MPTELCCSRFRQKQTSKRALRLSAPPRLNTAQVASEVPFIHKPLYRRCPQPIRGACCCIMIDDSHQHAESAEAILKIAYCRDGVDVAVQAAIHMISIAAALLTSETGPDESRRILQIVGDAQGKAS